MKKIDWNKASELGLVERVNKEVLHPLGLAMARDVDNGISPCLLVAPDGEFKYVDDYEFKPVLSKEQIQEEVTKGRGGINKESFDFLIDLISKTISGNKNSDVVIKAAENYIFDLSAWKETKEPSCGRVCLTKRSSKLLAEKVQTWHEVLSNWPDGITDKFKAIEKLGGKAISQNVINAVVQHVNDGINMNKAAVANDCFYQSVKSALAKIEKFDAAAKEYGEL